MASSMPLRSRSDGSSALARGEIVGDIPECEGAPAAGGERWVPQLVELLQLFLLFQLCAMKNWGVVNSFGVRNALGRWGVTGPSADAAVPLHHLLPKFDARITKSVFPSLPCGFHCHMSVWVALICCGQIDVKADGN